MHVCEREGGRREREPSCTCIVCLIYNIHMVWKCLFFPELVQLLVGTGNLSKTSLLS